MSQPRKRAVIVIGAGALSWIGLACGTSQKAECFCDSPAAVTIRAPSGAISAVKLGGACAGVFPSCQGNGDAVYPTGCAETLLFPRNTGTCDIEVDFFDGRAFRSSVSLVADGTCCGIVRAATPDGGTLAVP